MRCGSLMGGGQESTHTAVNKAKRLQHARKLWPQRWGKRFFLSPHDVLSPDPTAGHFPFSGDIR